MLVLRTQPFASHLEKQMDRRANTLCTQFYCGNTQGPAETSTHHALDRGSIVNEPGCGPEPIGLRSDFDNRE
jgi:hypothetical protein